VISKKRLDAVRRQLCEELGPDDGVDPRVRTRSEPTRCNNIRDQRLCGEVARILSLEVEHLILERVEPAPDATRLRVWVHAEDLETWTRLRPRLREAVAAAIQRKRAPDLIFAAVPA
jgi:hypothetical protein